MRRDPPLYLFHNKWMGRDSPDAFGKYVEVD